MPPERSRPFTHIAEWERSSGVRAKSPVRDKPESTRMAINGTVKFFNATKGYGFIQPDDGSKDAFVHISALERSGIGTINEGQKVSYELQTGRDGKVSATNLSLR